MTCDNCKGEGKVVNGHGVTVTCFSCNGTGEMCDVCGEASNVCEGIHDEDDDTDE